MLGPEHKFRRHTPRHQPPLTTNAPYDCVPVGSTYAASFGPGYAQETSTFADTPQSPMLPVTPTEAETDDAAAIKSEQTGDVAPKRKRGRPRIHRSQSNPNSPGLGHRVPHNEVEKKYRETLNHEMERLRLNVPTLPQPNGSSLLGPPKPSKATVLAAAVQYIKELEAENVRLVSENNGLRGGGGRVSRHDPKVRRERR